MLPSAEELERQQGLAPSPPEPLDLAAAVRASGRERPARPALPTQDPLAAFAAALVGAPSPPKGMPTEQSARWAERGARIGGLSLLPAQIAGMATGEAIAGPGGAVAGALVPGALTAGATADKGMAGEAAAEDVVRNLPMAAGAILAPEFGAAIGGPRLGAVVGSGAMLAPAALERRLPTADEIAFAALPIIHLQAQKTDAGRLNQEVLAATLPEPDRVQRIVTALEEQRAQDLGEPPIQPPEAPPEAPGGPLARPEPQSEAIGPARRPRPATGEAAPEPQPEPPLKVIPGRNPINAFLQDDLIPMARKVAGGAKTLADAVGDFFSPGRGVEPGTFDAIHRLMGQRRQADFIIRSTFKGLREFWEKTRPEDQIDFIDRYKRGAPQETKALDELAAMYRQIDEQVWKFADQSGGISPAWKDNHFRVFWKVIPGAPEAKGARPLGRRPLAGTGGMLKRSTLDSISEGIRRGGVPLTTNPQALFEMAQADLMKLASTNRMLGWMKRNGQAKFVPEGQAPPEGWTTLDDRVQRTYLKSDQGQGAGRYWFDPGPGRLLGRMLSRDLIRETAGGRGLVAAKMAMTGFELGFSAFHLGFEAAEATGSAAGLAARKLWNGAIAAPKGLGIGSRLAVAAGAGKELLGVPLASITRARLGGSLIRYAETPAEFAATTRGQAFLAAFPEAKRMVDHLFEGGGRIGMSEDYKVSTLRSFREAIKAGNPLGAIARSPLAATQFVMRPLFEEYIPRVKLGVWLKEFQQALSEEPPGSGKSQASIARDTWRFTEDRFGEMDFDNLFWNRTFKTAMQLLFRSVTWKLGNLRAAGYALKDQPLEMGRALREHRMPRLTQEMAWMAGMSGLTAALGTVISKAYTGLYPWEHDGPVLENVVFPHVDNQDDTLRISLPTYFRDYYHLQRNKTGYLASSLSSTATKLWELWQNRDFHGFEVYDPDGKLTDRAGQMIGHLFPVPFSVQSFMRMRQEGEPLSLQLGSGLGFTRAPGDVSMTPAQRTALDLARQQMPHARPYASREMAAARKDFASAIKHRTGIDEARARLELAGGTVSDMLRLAKLSSAPSIVTWTSRLGLDDALRVYDEATAEERQQLEPILRLKLLNRIKQGGSDVPALYQKAIAAGLVGQSAAP